MPHVDYFIQVFSEEKQRWRWIGQFHKEDSKRDLLTGIDRFNQVKDKKKAGKFAQALTIHNRTFIDGRMENINKPGLYDGYSIVRFLEKVSGVYHEFTYNPHKLKLGIKEYIYVAKGTYGGK
jgi:hypothetical protein